LKGGKPNFTVKIQESTFGSTVVEDKKYQRDMLIFADGIVKKRQGGFLMFGSHEIKKRELEQLSQGQPEAISIGTGTNGAAHKAPEAQSWARQEALICSCSHRTPS